MTTAIDSSVLIAIGNGEPGHEAWQEVLDRAAQEGVLTICPVVLAELSARYPSLEPLAGDLERLGIRIDGFSDAACFLAGETFRRYRAQGGPRTTMIPDFMVAAHAQKQADRLAAMDRGYLRSYFASLCLLAPP